MNNNQNYGPQNAGGQQPPQGQPNNGGQQPSQGQPNNGGQQPSQGQPNYGGQQQPPQQPNMQYQQPNGGWQQPPQGYQPQYNMQWQQPPKKKMSTGCIVGLVLGILFLIGVVICGVLVLMGAMVFNSVTSEIDSIGSEFYNTAFELYLGDNKPADSVYRLMAVIKANNEEEEQTNIIDVEIELSNGTVLTYSNYNSDLIPRDSKYYIEAEKNSKGYISEVFIEEL